MARLKRDPNKRRIPVSSCVTHWVSQDLEETCCYHNISISELISRVLSKACYDSFPTDRAEFDKLYPYHYELSEVS